MNKTLFGCAVDVLIGQFFQDADDVGESMEGSSHGEFS